jgi:chromosome segregation ATPase
VKIESAQIALVLAIIGLILIMILEFTTVGSKRMERKINQILEEKQLLEIRAAELETSLRKDLERYDEVIQIHEQNIHSLEAAIQDVDQVNQQSLRDIQDRQTRIDELFNDLR